MTVTVLGIRHHGPGSARSLCDALQHLQPDCILIEGPPEGEAILSLVASEQMQPPVALLVYAPDVPNKAAYYPFAIFSPEWQAIKFGLAAGIPVRFIDLPQTNWMAMDKVATATESETDPDPNSDQVLPTIPKDPLSWLAKAAGYSDGERWWEHMVEQRKDSTDVFEAILEAMTILRNEVPVRNDRMDPYREAYMRNSIRAAIKAGHQKIAVVCGAWHAPVLENMPAAKDDALILKGLPKMKVESTWIPWNHSRLSFASGYGAGVTSPGWYQHLWTYHDRIVERWMTLVARLLREEDLDASSAHAIEAVRLAETLSAMRERSAPGLIEIMEAIETVICNGNDIPLRLIHEKLIVGEVLGRVPDATPSVPVQRDLQREQKRLRLPAEASERILDLDLRKEIDLERSRLLHRLNLLNIPWGRLQNTKGKSGTFHEIWQLRWKPEYSLHLIDAGKWGKTVLEAAEGRAQEIAQSTDTLSKLTALLDAALLSDIKTTVDFIIKRVQCVAALAGDIGHLMDAIPDLVRVARYGNVRKTDIVSVENVIEGILARIWISLPSACSSINDDAAGTMFVRVVNVHSAINLLQVEDHSQNWLIALLKVADGASSHGLLAGRATRLLLEQRFFSIDEAARRLGFALSSATDARSAAVWIEGFLRGSGLLLIHDDGLWTIVDDWLNTLSVEKFSEILPLLKRTFSTFEPAERRQMGEKVVGEKRRSKQFEKPSDLNLERADSVLPVALKLLGIEL
ncbi:MAG: hypothetical protein IAF58_00540 [Leptolyngbya sp.]|nr:hypothetical protein [Candidatus Melainabacteria bacterium]